MMQKPGLTPASPASSGVAGNGKNHRACTQAAQQKGIARQKTDSETQQKLRTRFQSLFDRDLVSGSRRFRRNPNFAFRFGSHVTLEKWQIIPGEECRVVPR
jgi:hypothetical protein